jgi:hypothetical protein
VLKVESVLRDQLALRVYKVLPDQQVLRELLAPKVLLVIKAQLEPLVHKAHKE